MKKLFLSFLFLFLISLLSAQETYYWYEGTKIPLRVIGETYYISYEENTEIDNFLFSENNKDKVVGNGVLQLLGINYINKPLTPIHWAVVTKELQKDILNLFEIPYITPDYEAEGGNVTIKVSNLLYVKLKHEADYTLLEQYAAVHKTTIVGEDDSMENLFILLCTDISEGSAVDVANYLYETGVFEYAEPDLFTLSSMVIDAIPSYFIGEDSTPKISLSPNPVKDKLTLTLSQAENEIKIFDLQGKLLLQQNVGFSAEINVSMLQAGTYVLVVNGESYKFVKE